MVRNFLDVRRNKTSHIPPFEPPHGPDDEAFEVPEESYDQPDMGYANTRPSVTYERPFDGAVPASYARADPYARSDPSPFRDPPQYNNPYAANDPYDRIRHSLGMRDDSLRQMSPAPQLPPLT